MSNPHLTVAEPPAAFTIKEFCQAHRISIPTFYELRKVGLAPAEMRMGAMVRISREAAATWRRARENPGKAEAEATAHTADAMRDRARRAAKRAVASPLHISNKRREVA
jgi:predicted DNA-binding transcriptional regulator AlpA